MTTARPSPDVAARFRETAFHLLPLGCLATAAATALITGPGWSLRMAALPWIASLLIVGLPHGAADFAISRRAWRGWPLVGLWLAYVATMAVVATCFTLAPAAVMAMFAALSCWHFGMAHVEDDGLSDGWPRRAIAAVARGGAVLAPALVVWPVATAQATADLVSLAIHRGPPAPTVLHPELIRAAGLLLAALTTASVVVEAMVTCREPAGPRRGLRLLLDVATIAALGCLTVPLFSVGLYFLAWHGWRQMDRLATAVTGHAPRSWRELALGVARVHTSALPLLVPTWFGLAIAWWLWSPGHSPRDLAILSIGVYLVVTPAHEVLGDLLRAVCHQPHPAPSAGPLVPRRGGPASCHDAIH